MSGERPSDPRASQAVVMLLGLPLLWALVCAVLAGQAAGALTGSPVRLVHGFGWAAIATYAQGPGAAFTPAPPGWLLWPLLVLFWAVPVVGAMWVWSRFFGGPGLGGARWGGRGTELRLAAPEEPEARVDRMAFGRGQATGRVLAGAPCISGTVFGQPGSGKTTGLLLPIAAEWKGPVIMTTVKASDFDAIYKLRAALGPVWVIAPAGLPDRQTACWSPVDYSVDGKAADRMAKWLADAAATAGDSRSAPWVEQASSAIKGVLLAAHLARGGIAAFRSWLSLAEKAVDDVRGVLIDGGYPEVADDYAGGYDLHDDGVGSIKFTTSVITRVYADEEVRETASRTDFTAEQFLDECGTVCLIASEADGERFAPLLTAISASLIHAAQARYQETGKPLSPALGVLIDEAGNCFRYPKLARLLTVARGMGIGVFTVWHDLSQLIGVMGREGAHTVLNASGLRMLLPGNADPETLKYFNTLLGRTEVMRTSTSHSSSGTSTSDQPVETDLAPINTLREQDDHTAIAVYANRRPLKVNLRRTYADDDLIALLAGTPPTEDTPAAVPAQPAAPTTVPKQLT